MSVSSGPRGEAASVRAALAIVAADPGPARRDAGAILADSLERTDLAPIPARVERATALEGPGPSPRKIIPATTDGCVAFLDGIQQSRVLHHIDGIVPVVHATVAAAIRVRRERVLCAWGGGARVMRTIILPRALVDRRIVAALEADGFLVEDSAPAPEHAAHPLQLLAAARLIVQQRREATEAALAGEWSRAGQGALYVDGGIGGLSESARGSQVIGVVKSHRTLYGEPGIAKDVAALRAGERSGAFAVSTRRRTVVASWYLRLRESSGDPLGGLVRVEIAEPSFSSARADEVSSWILREREPAALPDPRWRVMAYGIRACEQYLRAATA